MSARLPRVVVWLLEQRLSAEWREFILGDLEEEFRARPPSNPSDVVDSSRPQGDPMIRTLLSDVRTSVPPTALAQPAARAVRAIDPEQPVEDIRPLADVVDDTLASRRFSAVLLGLFASVALVLATVGIYSVLSYIVRGRSHEIGIRTALGARTSDVVRMVMIEGMTPTAVGIAVGTAVALAAGTALRKLVFGVSASDPLTLVVVAGSLFVVALTACLVPAYRASRLDPLTVLRAD